MDEVEQEIARKLGKRISERQDELFSDGDEEIVRLHRGEISYKQYRDWCRKRMEQHAQELLHELAAATTKVLVGRAFKSVFGDLVDGGPAAT